MPEAPLLHLTDVVKHFPLGGGVFAKPTAWVKAVCGVSFRVQRGESFGLVGESGCGKTTIGRMILRLIEPTGGRIEFDGEDMAALSRKGMGRLRRRMQIIFQDPYSSLDPRMTVEQIITEPLRAGPRPPRAERRKTAKALLDKVGLRAADLDKYPHEFSGGRLYFPSRKASRGFKSFLWRNTASCSRADLNSRARARPPAGSTAGVQTMPRDANSGR